MKKHMGGNFDTIIDAGLNTPFAKLTLHHISHQNVQAFITGV